MPYPNRLPVTRGATLVWPDLKARDWTAESTADESLEVAVAKLQEFYVPEVPEVLALHGQNSGVGLHEVSHLYLQCLALPRCRAHLRRAVAGTKSCWAAWATWARSGSSLKNCQAVTSCECLLLSPRRKELIAWRPYKCVSCGSFSEGGERANRSGLTSSPPPIRLVFSRVALPRPCSDDWAEAGCH